MAQTVTAPAAHHLLRFKELPGFCLIVKILLAKAAWSGMIDPMHSVQEIEMALRQLPPQERWEIARRLLEELQEGALSNADGKGSGDNGGQSPPLPDYSARRRRIFGNKILPNMVLVARAEERW
jgi:hypothetical protein